MRRMRTVFLTSVLFFLFHQTTFSPIGQLASADTDDTAAPSREKVNWTEVSKHRPSSAHIDAPIVSQLPELYNGCEVTTLAMLLMSQGVPADKLELARTVPKDPTSYKENSLGQIVEWGDPNAGFVGDMIGGVKGYGVNSGPIFQLLSKYLTERAIYLTGQEFAVVEWMISEGSPVMVWTTTSFQPTDEWVTWKKGNQDIKVTFKEHAVLAVGYDDKYVYVNDPLSGEKNLKVPKISFLQSWNQLGKQAVSVLSDNAKLVTRK